MAPAFSKLILAASFLGAALEGFALEVAGTVRDSSGSPLPDVRICLLPGPTPCTQSDSLGTFAIASSNAGAWRKSFLPGTRDDQGPSRHYRLDGKSVAGHRGLATLAAGRYVSGAAGFPAEKRTSGAAKAAEAFDSLIFAKRGYLPVTYVPKASVESGVDIRLGYDPAPLEFDLVAGIGSAHLAWYEVPGAEEYHVRHKRHGAPDSQAIEAEASSPFRVEGLRPGEAYEFQVAFKRPGGPAVWSRAVVSRQVLTVGMMGEAGITQGAANYFTADMGNDDRVWIAFSDASRDDAMSVMRHTEGGWEYVGQRGFSSPISGKPQSPGPMMGLSARGTGDAVAWWRNSGSDTIHYATFDGTRWNSLGKPTRGWNAFARSSDALYSGASDSQAACKWNGSDWVELPALQDHRVGKGVFGRSGDLTVLGNRISQSGEFMLFRLEETGWTAISPALYAIDRDLTVTTTVLAGGRQGVPYFIPHFATRPQPVFRLPDTGMEILDGFGMGEYLATDDDVLVALDLQQGTYKYYDGPGKTWAELPVEGGIPPVSGNVLHLMDSKDRLYRVYREPDGNRVSVAILAP